jgi:myo-inositol-1(or 4)-monophosphatase
MANTSPILNIMIKAAEKAGRSLTRDFGEVENLQVSRKGPANFVTAADKRAEEIIFEELKNARPDYGFLMEEGGVVEGNNSEHKWIIDPLDGTHNFMHGIPHWAVSIALETKGRVEAGVVYDPIKEETFIAERSGGAWLNGRKRLRVSANNNLESSTIAFGSAQMNIEKQNVFMRELRTISSQAPMVRRMGAAALDLSYIAAGRLDGYWERDIQPWDLAAGVLIVKEAGGFANSIDNEQNPIYNNQIVAGNQAIYDHLRKNLRDVAKKAA